MNTTLMIQDEMELEDDDDVVRLEVSRDPEKTKYNHWIKLMVEEGDNKTVSDCDSESSKGGAIPLRRVRTKVTDFICLVPYHFSVAPMCYETYSACCPLSRDHYERSPGPRGGPFIYNPKGPLRPKQFACNCNVFVGNFALLIGAPMTPPRLPPLVPSRAPRDRPG